MAKTAADVFWDDLDRDLADPELRRLYERESVRIATIDRIVNLLDEARAAAGMSKTDLARAIGAQPAVIRRLFTSPDASPTLSTVAQVAAALGLRVTLVPAGSKPRATRKADPTNAAKAGRAKKSTAAARRRPAKDLPNAAA